MHPFKHFNTITKHRHQVIKCCFRAGIGFQGLFHDLSKYTPVEFFEGAKYYQGTRSPNDRAREVNGCSKAWLHHKGRNRHHFEYWTDYNPATHKMSPVPMPKKYIAEMFCDRVAASKIYMGKSYNNASTLEYFLRGKPVRSIHPETSQQIEMLLTMLAQKGEAETFKYIKNIFLKK